MKHAVLLILPLALAACTGGGSSLLGGGNKPESAAAKLVSSPINDPRTRAVQVAWNVSRAAKCGFNLDAVQLKQNYLAYESGQGLTPDRLPALEKAYEFSRIETADRINKAEGKYCNEKRVTETRADLGRYLAGDFAARQIAQKKQPAPGLFDVFDTGEEPKQRTSDEALATKE